MAKLRPVTHVIFDMDGLILDSQRVYSAAQRTECLALGFVLTADLESRCAGLQTMHAAEKIVAELGLPISASEFKHRCVVDLSDVHLLPDTEKIYLRVISAIAEQYGRKYTLDVRMKVLGTMEKDTARIAVKEMDLPIEPDEFNRQQVESQNRLLGEAEFMPGAERLIRHLHANNIPIAVATSSGADSVKIKTARHTELFALFDHMVMANTDPEVEHGKPAPDIFRICAARFPDKPPVEQCLVFEDAPNGVTAGIAAGMQVVMVPDPNTAEEKRRHATLVIGSLLDFQPELFGLPPF